MGKDVEERKVVGRAVTIEEISKTEPILVGSKVNGSIVIEGGIEVVSIEEEGREAVFKVGKDVEERKVVGSFVDG